MAVQLVIEEKLNFTMWAHFWGSCREVTSRIIMSASKRSYEDDVSCQTLLLRRESVSASLASTKLTGRNIRCSQVKKATLSLLYHLQARLFRGWRWRWCSRGEASLWHCQAPQGSQCYQQTALNRAALSASDSKRQLFCFPSDWLRCLFSFIRWYF